MATAFTGSVFCQKLKQQVAETPGRFRAVVGSSRRVKWKKCRPATRARCCMGRPNPLKTPAFMGMAKTHSFVVTGPPMRGAHAYASRQWQFWQKFSVNVSPVPNPPYFYETITVGGNFFALTGTLHPGSPSPSPVPTNVPIYDYAFYNVDYDATEANLVWSPLLI